MGVKVDGVHATLRALAKTKRNDGEAIADGLYVCAVTLYKKSQELVPVDTGDLKESGRVWQYGTGFNARATVEYVNDYAVPVHEILTAEHAPPTQARYLADAVHKSRGTMAARLKRELRVKMEKK
jgi:hypothetical protein